MENSQKSRGGKTILTAYREAYLVSGFLKQTLTEEEKDELDAWILASDDNMIRFEKMTDEKNLQQAKEWFKKHNVDAGFDETKRKYSNRKLRFWPYAVAAAVILLIIAGIYIYRNNAQRHDKPPIVQTQDMAPGSSLATLRLDNGNVIELRSDGSDTTINNLVKVLRKDGQLIYSSSQTNEVAYHTLTVPRKGQYKVTLPDGTKAWLNAESSIRYPVSFNGNERKVYVTGETFFEVAEDQEKPFRVVSNDITIEALGTQFNVSGYNNEPFFSATLIEGSVLITKGSQENILKPGQQAKLSGSEFQIVKANSDSATAWKNNQFKFINTPIDAIMRQVERWYDAEVEYQDKFNLQLNATIERDVPVSKLLHILEETGEVKFKIEGRKIIVTR